MNQKDPNQLLELYNSGKINEKQFTNEICSFVSKNYPVYGLHKYDEDFRQDIIVSLLEKCPHIIHLFNHQYGDFFTFLYCYVCSLINTKIKSLSIISVREKLSMEEFVNIYNEKQYKYHTINYTHLESPKPPLAPKKIPPEELQEALKSLSLKHKDKKVFILALKSSYYITDEQINRICELYHFKPEYFYSMIQQCKESLENKSFKREQAYERRNFAYYHHKRYNRIIKDLTENEISERNYVLQHRYESMEKKHTQNWKRLNRAFENGLLYLRPTTKTVANLMGICERQVSYYINTAKKEIEEMDNAVKGKSS